jgi:hypothetical protein
MYRLSIYKKSPVFFNSFEEFKTKLYKDPVFANSLVEVPVMLQKVDQTGTIDQNVYYNIDFSRFPHENLIIALSDFDLRKMMVSEFKDDNYFTIVWEQDKESICHFDKVRCTMSVSEWEDYKPASDALIISSEYEKNK